MTSVANDRGREFTRAVPDPILSSREAVSDEDTNIVETPHLGGGEIRTKENEHHCWRYRTSRPLLPSSPKAEPSKRHSGSCFWPWPDELRISNYGYERADIGE